MANRTLTAAEFAQQQVQAQSQLARFSEPEQWFSQPVVMTGAGGPINVQPPGPMPLTRPAEGLTLDLRGRINVATAAYTAVAPEAIPNLVQMVQLQGNHKDYGSVTPIRMTGPFIYAWGRIFQLQSGGGDILISKAAGALTLAPQPSRPMVSTFDGAVAAHDFILQLHIPFGPSVRQDSMAILQDTNFLLQPYDWGNTMNGTFTLGDGSALGEPAGTTAVTFTGFQSAGGNPQFTASINYALLGDFQNKMGRSGVIVRNEQQLPNQLALGNSIVLAQLAHQITTTVVLKTGRFQTGAAPSSQIDTLSSLTDLQMERTQLVIDNKPLRNNTNNLLEKSYHQRMFVTVVPEGYLPLTFVESGTSLTAYRGDKLPGGSQWNLQSDVSLAQSNQRQRMVQEYILGGPFPA